MYAEELTLLARVAGIVLGLVVFAACVAAIVVVFRLPGYMDRQERRLQQIVDAAERTSPAPKKVLFKSDRVPRTKGDEETLSEFVRQAAADESVAHEDH